MRDWSRIDAYLNKLAGDIYPQPPDPGHTALAQKVIDFWLSRLTDCHTVLDVGAGEGFCQPMFERWGVRYDGVALGEDVVNALNASRNVKRMDFSFLEYEDKSFDLVFARHAWEHSPMPLLTLMEWGRVARNWIGIVLPAPEWYTYKGRNHYSVMNWEQIANLLDVAGWKIMWERVDEVSVGNKKHPEITAPHEYWIMAERK